MDVIIGFAKEIGLPGYLLLVACGMVYMMSTLHDIKKGMRWNDTCDERHENVQHQIDEIDVRVDKLETKVYGL